MAEEKSTFNAAKLRRGLRILTHGQGIYRSDICDLLGGRLRELRTAFSIDTEKDPDVVQSALGGILHGHIYQLTPRRSRDIDLTADARLRQYRRIVAVSFNMLPHIIGPGTTTLQKRRAWLVDDVHVSERTTQRDLNHAIEQIADRIVRGLPTPPAPVESLTERPMVMDGRDPSAGNSVEPSDTHSSSSLRTMRRADSTPLLPDSAPTILNRGRHWKLATSLAAVIVLLAAAAWAILKPFSSGSSGPSSTPPRPTAQPSAVSAANGPVHVDSVAYIPHDTDRTYVVAQGMTLSKPELESLNKLNGNLAEYAKWMLGHSAVLPSPASLKIDLRGAANQTAVVTDIQVVAHCDKPLTGTLLYSPGAAPPVEAVGLRIDLDHRFPVVQATDSDESYFGGKHAHVINLTAGDTTSLLVSATTSSHYCAFTLTLIIDVGNTGQPVSEMIDYNGKPFEITALVPNAGNTDLKFSDYQVMYAGGTASPTGDDAFVQVNPATYPK